MSNPYLLFDNRGQRERDQATHDIDQAINSFATEMKRLRSFYSELGITDTSSSGRIVGATLKRALGTSIASGKVLVGYHVPPPPSGGSDRPPKESIRVPSWKPSIGDRVYFAYWGANGTVKDLIEEPTDGLMCGELEKALVEFDDIGRLPGQYILHVRALAQIS